MEKSTTETELALRPEQTLQAGELIPSMAAYNLIKTQSAELIRTGFLPRHLDTPEKAAAVVLIGRELGIPMMQALRKVYVVQGTPALSSELMLALVNRTKEVDDLTIMDDGQTCKVTITRKGRTPHTTTFSMEDAAKMGLAGKDNWNKQPKVMRQWRAVAAACRAVFPDAIGGMYTLEEIAPNVAVDTTGSPTGALETEEPVTMAKAKVVEVKVKDPEFPQEVRKAQEEAEQDQPATPGMIEGLTLAIKAKKLTKGQVRTYMTAHFNQDDLAALKESQVETMLQWIASVPVHG